MMLESFCRSWRLCETHQAHQKGLGNMAKQDCSRRNIICKKQNG